MVDISTLCMVSVPSVGKCFIFLGERMEVVKEFKYLRNSAMQT